MDSREKKSLKKMLDEVSEAALEVAKLQERLQILRKINKKGSKPARQMEANERQ